MYVILCFGQVWSNKAEGLVKQPSSLHVHIYMNICKHKLILYLTVVWVPLCVCGWVEAALLGYMVPKSF